MPLPTGLKTQTSADQAFVPRMLRGTPPLVALPVCPAYAIAHPGAPLNCRAAAPPISAA